MSVGFWHVSQWCNALTWRKSSFSFRFLSRKKKKPTRGDVLKSSPIFEGTQPSKCTHSMMLYWHHWMCTHSFQYCSIEGRAELKLHTPKVSLLRRKASFEGAFPLCESSCCTRCIAYMKPNVFQTSWTYVMWVWVKKSTGYSLDRLMEEKASACQWKSIEAVGNHNNNQQ